MSVGTPALVNSNGGMAEIVENNMNGWYLDPLNTDNLLALIRDIFITEQQDQKLINFSLQAVSRIRRDYDIEVVGPKILEYYRNIISNA